VIDGLRVVGSKNGVEVNYKGIVTVDMSELARRLLDTIIPEKKTQSLQKAGNENESIGRFDHEDTREGEDRHG